MEDDLSTIGEGEAPGHPLDEGGSLTTLAEEEGAPGYTDEPTFSEPADTEPEPVAEPVAEPTEPVEQPEAEQPAEQPAEPPIVNREGEPVASDGAAAQAQPAEEPGGAEPEEDEPKGQTIRLYKLLHQTGTAAWAEVPLPDPAEEDWVHLHNGERLARARNTDHARRLAYVALGRPQQGARIVVVARTGWQPRTIRPAPPKPDKERLEIT